MRSSAARSIDEDALTVLDQKPSVRRRGVLRNGRRSAALWLGVGVVLAALGQQMLTSPQNTPLALVLYGLGLGMLVILALAAQRGPRSAGAGYGSPIQDQDAAYPAREAARAASTRAAAIGR